MSGAGGAGSVRVAIAARFARVRGHRAAGVATAKLIMSSGVRNILGFDRQGILHRNTAARYKSRLSQALGKLNAPAVETA